MRLTNETNNSYNNSYKQFALSFIRNGVDETFYFDTLNQLKDFVKSNKDIRIEHAYKTEPIDLSDCFQESRRTTTKLTINEGLFNWSEPTYCYTGTYDFRATVTYSNTTYFMYSTECNTLEDAKVLGFQISESHPYDEADYVWAKLNKGSSIVRFFKNNKQVDTLQLGSLYDDDYDDTNIWEWTNNIIETTIETLHNLNKSVKPIKDRT